MTLKVLDLSNTSTAYFSPATITAPNSKLLHVSGQIGATKSGHVPPDYESQLHLALLNLRRIIVTAGASVTDIVKMTVYIVDFDPKARKHARPIQRFYGKHRPAMTLVPVTQLANPAWLFEVDAMVVIPEPTTIARSLKAPAQSVDVVIVGAGLAGLSAARDIIRAGLSCVVLEARDRVGGRTYSLTIPDGRPGIVEAGAGWINDVNQPQMIALVREFGLETIEQNTTGNCALQDLDGNIFPFPYGEVPSQFGAASVQDIIRIRDGTEADCQVVDIFKPTDTHLDSMTFEAYLRSRNASEDAIWTATVWTRAMLGIDPRDVSALFFLNYCKSGGGLLTMRSDRKGGGQHLRIREGTQMISTKLADTLPRGTVRLNKTIQQVAHNYGDASVTTTDGTVFNGCKVISTLPSPVLKTIDFQPVLHPAKRAWSEAANYGYYCKAMMVFKTPFWVQKGFCGLAQSFTGPAAVVRDSCSPCDNCAVLTCFMAGPPAQEWSLHSQPARIEKLLHQLGQLFNAQDIIWQEFVDMVLYDWIDDEFTGYGCPCAHLPPGVLDAVGPTALREATGNLHFAGTETAGEWKGYMEGAVRSGQRAAREVIEGLRSGILARL